VDYVLAYSAESRTGVDGRFEINGLQLGRWGLVLSVGDRAWVERELDLTRGVEPEPAEIALPSEAPVIEGRVLLDGLPKSGAKVDIGLGSDTRTVTSGADGRFRAAGMNAEETYRIRATLRGQDGRVWSTTSRTAAVGTYAALHLEESKQLAEAHPHVTER
jgi:hypothetical protein